MKKILSITISLLLLVSCFSAVLGGNAAAADIRRISVTINGDAKTSRGIAWYTSAKSDSIVKVLKASDYAGGFDGAAVYNGTCSAFQDNFVHKVTVDKLQSNTAYVYIVGDGTNWSELGRFMTAIDSAESFSFITIADVQASSDENFRRAALVMAAANAKVPDSKFVVNLGDFVNDCTNDEWDWYSDNFSFTNTQTTIVPVSGNHEGNLKWFWFNNMFNIGAAKGSATTTGCYYSFDYGNAHIAVLNSNDMYPMTLQQMNWLKNDMSKSDADWKFVFMHRALYSAGKNINKPDTIMMRNNLLPLIDELDIDIVMAGHDHMYFRSEQVKGDAVVPNVQYVVEEYKGEQVTFAVNPDGTTHILPSTAGTKRYDVRENVMPPILDCGAVVKATKEFGVYSTIDIVVEPQTQTTKFVFNAYGYNEETQESVLVDSYAIKKDMGQNTVDPNYEEAPTDSPLLTLQNILRLFTSLGKYFVDLFTKVLPNGFDIF